MDKKKCLKILNPILALLILSQLLSGIFGRSLPHEMFVIVHKGGAYLLATGIGLHLWLNWNWIKTTYLQKR